MVVPTTVISWKKIRVSSAGSASPLVAPATTMVPPGRTDRTECDQVAFPTLSRTTSTRGTRAPGSTAAAAPSASARARRSSDRLVTITSSPAAAPSRIAAVASPPPAPCTSTRCPGVAPPDRKSIRYAVSQAVGRQAASTNESSAGLSTRFQVGTATCSASVPGYRSDSRLRGSSGPTPCPFAPPITPCTTTSRPSAVTPAASVPRIIGSASARSPTPRSVHTSWWFSAAARTSTTDQLSRASGAGCSPTSRALTGSSGENRAA